MLSYELHTNSISEIENIWNSSILNYITKQVTRNYEKVIALLAPYVRDGAGYLEHKSISSQLLQYHDDPLSLAKDIKEAIYTFQNNASASYLYSETRGISGCLSELKTAIRELEQEFDNENSQVDWLVFASKVKDFRYQIEIYFRVLNDISKALSNDVATRDNQSERLSLIIEAEYDLSQFASNLNSLDAMYKEIAHLMDISLSEHPIKVVIIESGSFWADVLGYPKIIELMQNMIEGTISYFHRNFTVEGKIYEVPRKVDAIESIIHLRKQLKGLGIKYR